MPFSSCIYPLSRFINWFSCRHSRFPFPAVILQLSRSVADQYLAQLPLSPHPQLSALSLLRLCHMLSSSGEGYCQHGFKWISPAKKSFMNPFSRLVCDPVPFRSLLLGHKCAEARPTEIAKLGALWEYAITSHQIPLSTSLSEFLQCLKPLCPLFIYINSPSLSYSWQLSKNQGSDLLMSEEVMRSLIVGWQPWVRPGLRRKLAANSHKFSFSIFKLVPPSDRTNGMYLDTVELQCKWKALLHLVPPHFISVESLKARLLNQTTTPIQNTMNRPNHDQGVFTSLQWQDFTQQSPLFHGLEWSLDQYSLRLASCEECINAGCKPDLLQVCYGAANANDDQAVGVSTLPLPLHQRPVLFYAALGLIAQAVPTFFTPLDIVQRRYASQSRAALKELRERSASPDISGSSLTDEEFQWLERHFSHLEPLLDHPDLRFAVEVRDAAEGVLADQPASFQARLPLSGALVRLHTDFFHPSRGGVDPYFLYQFHSLPFTKQLDPVGPCGLDTSSSTPRCRYEVRLCGVCTPSSSASMEPIHKLLSESPSHRFPPCVVVDVIGMYGPSAAVSNPSCRDKQGGEGSRSTELVLGICSGSPSIAPSFELFGSEVSAQAPLFGVVHIFTFRISNSSTEWWCDLPPPVLNLLRSEGVLKLLLASFTKPLTPTGCSYEKGESFVRNLRWPKSFGSLGDLVMLTQFTGYPINGNEFSIELLKTLLMRRLGVSLHLAATDTQFPNTTFRDVAEATAMAHALFLTIQCDTHDFCLLYYGSSVPDSSVPNAEKCGNPFCRSWINFVRSSSSYRLDHSLTVRLHRYLCKWFPGLNLVGGSLTMHPGKSSLRDEAMECIKMPAHIFTLPLHRKKELLMEMAFLYGPETLPQLSSLGSPGRVSQLSSASTEKESLPALISRTTGTAHNLSPESVVPLNEREHGIELKLKWDCIHSLEREKMRMLGKEVKRESPMRHAECKERDEIKVNLSQESECSISPSSSQTANDNDFLSELLASSSQSSSQQGAAFDSSKSLPCPNNQLDKSHTSADEVTAVSSDQGYTTATGLINEKHTSQFQRLIENGLVMPSPSPQLVPSLGTAAASTSPSLRSETGSGLGGSVSHPPRRFPFPPSPLSEGLSSTHIAAGSGYGKPTVGFRVGDYKPVFDKDSDPKSWRKKGHSSYHRRDVSFQGTLSASPPLPGMTTPLAFQGPPQGIANPTTTTVKATSARGFTTFERHNSQAAGGDAFQPENDRTDGRPNALPMVAPNLNSEKLRLLIQTEEGISLLKELLR
ncbi:unnamed protein product [Phytomonas sp. EM1]|nr:unnamed protein product [Phytomonas sp. EM1]|eukprot:CCW60667.1 unnamed protein product [Phytomonas sp. isolate EM1]